MFDVFLAAITHFFLWHYKTLFDLVWTRRVSRGRLKYASYLSTYRQNEPCNDAHYKKMLVLYSKSSFLIASHLT